MENYHQLRSSQQKVLEFTELKQSRNLWNRLTLSATWLSCRYHLKEMFIWEQFDGVRTMGGCFSGKYGALDYAIDPCCNQT
jgi:hypothetical protein